MTKPRDVVTWQHDLIPLLLPSGFELGWTGESAWGTDKTGTLWAVTVVPERGRYRTYWYRFTHSLDKPSESYGEMTREKFIDLFLLEKHEND